MNKKFYGYKAAAGAILLAFMGYGTALLLSIFLPNVAEGCGVGSGAIMYYTTIATAVAVVAAIFMGKLIEKTSIATVCGIAGFSAGMLCILLGTAHSITQVYIAALFSGIDVAFGLYAPVAIIVNQWFIEKRSQMTGIGVGIMSLGAVVMLFLFSRLQYVIGWRMCYISLGIVNIIIALALAFIIIKTPEQMGQKPLGWTPGATGDDEEDTSSKPGLTLTQALKTPAFWLILLAGVIFAAANEGVLSFGPTFLSEECGLSASLSSDMAVILQVFVFVGGLVAGWVGEKKGNKTMTVVLTVLLVVGLVILYIWPNTLSIVLLAASMVLIGIGGATYGNVTPLICSDCFGDKEYEKINPMYTSAASAGSAISAPLMNIAIAVGSMKYFYLVGAGASVVALLLCFLAYATNPMKKLSK